MEEVINIEFTGEAPTDFQKVGYYYKSNNHVSKQYIVEAEIKEANHNTIVKISEIPIQNDNLLVGSKIAICEHELDLMCEIDLWNKYFFPKFNNKMQMYYDDNDKWKADEIASLSDVINYAIKKGLEIGGIETY